MISVFVQINLTMLQKSLPIFYHEKVGLASNTEFFFKFDKKLVATNRYMVFRWICVWVEDRAATSCNS